MKKWTNALFMCWSMFLAIPCPIKHWDEAGRKRMLAMLPLIGVIVGASWVGCAYLTSLFACPSPLRALLLAAFPWLLSGFMHLDGYMDVCDAVLSRRDLQARQKILKDAHCGSFAVVCMVLLALAQYSVFSANADIPYISLGAIPVMSRACAALAVQTVRPMGTSQYAAMTRSDRYVLFPVVVLVAALALPMMFCGVRGAACAVTALSYGLAAWWGVKQLGGMNGDISGFALTLSELCGITAMMWMR